MLIPLKLPQLLFTVPRQTHPYATFYNKTRMRLAYPEMVNKREANPSRPRGCDQRMQIEDRALTICVKHRFG